MFITVAPSNGERLRMRIASRGGISGAAASFSDRTIVLPPRSTAERGDAAERLFAEAEADAAAVVDRLAVDGGDDVAALQARFRRRPAFDHVGDQRADRPVEPDRIGDFLGDVLQRSAEPRPLDRRAAAPARPPRRP